MGAEQSPLQQPLEYRTQLNFPAFETLNIERSIRT